MADLITNKITRLYDFEPKKTAKSGEINNEFNQFVDSIANVVDDLTAINDEAVGNTTDLVQVKLDTAEALDTANNADGKADTAITTANDASAVASTADGKADTAITTANEADAKADTAISTADQAVIDAQAAATSADLAQTAAENAETAVALKADVAYVDSVANAFQLGEVMPDSILRTQLNSVVTDELDTLAIGISDNATAIGDNATAISTKATKYQGNADFPIGVSTYQVNSATCTANTLVDVYIQSAEGVKLGVWEVEAFAGYFIITTDTLETSLVNFEWKYEV